MTSPGFTALPDGRFSDEGTIPTTFAGTPSSATTCIAASTAAPPDMSNFMSSMPEAGLMEMPPASKVRPLPTRTSGGSPSVPPRCSRTIRRASSVDPLETARIACIPSRRRASSSNTVTESPSSPATRSASAARCEGVARLPGRDWSVRAKFSPRATISPTRAPSASSPASPSPKRSARSTGAGGSSSTGRFSSVKRHAARVAPSAAACARAASVMASSGPSQSAIPSRRSRSARRTPRADSLRTCSVSSASGLPRPRSATLLGPRSPPYRRTSSPALP